MRNGMLIGAVVAAPVLFGCASDAPEQSAPPQFDRSVCATEAVLLEGDQRVWTAPDRSGERILPAMTPVYLCDKADDLQRILYPEPGAPADCSRRTQNPCPIGYLSPAATYQILG